MPRLLNYTARVSGNAPSIAGRRATAADTGGLAGAALQGLGQTVTSASEFLLTKMEEDEQRQVLVRQAELRAKYTKRLDDAVNTGEDLDKIREAFENDTAAVYEGLSTRKGRTTADLHTANSGQLFEARANDIQVTRAVTQARVDGNKFLNATGAILSANPSYLPQAEADMDAFVGTLSRVPPEKRQALAADLKQNLNVAAAMGNARLDPEGTKRAIEGGAYDMSPAQRQQVMNRADTEIRARRTDEAYQVALADRAKRELDDTARDEYMKQLVGAGGLNLREVANDPRLRTQTREHMIMLARAWSREQQGLVKRSNPVVVKDLWIRIHAPEDDSRRIFNADAIFAEVEKGEINVSDANQLNVLVANQKDANNRTIASRLNENRRIVSQQLSGKHEYKAQPALLAAIEMEYTKRVYERVDELRTQNKNPNEVFDRASKLWVGSPEFIQGAIDAVRPGGKRASLESIVRGEAVQDPKTGKWWKWSGQGEVDDPKNYIETPSPLSQNPTKSPLVEQIPK